MGEMTAGRFPLFSLMVCFLVCSSDAQKIITADLGQDVILPCKVPNNNNIIITAVEWSRRDQDPEYVFLYRNGRFDPFNQDPSYQNRVDLQDKEMKNGDVSLILKNVTKEDTGKYVCRVFEEGKIDPISNTLEVHLSALEIIPAELGQDVILPCKVPSKYNIKDIVVEWIRPEMYTDHVLLYRNGRLDPDNQHPSYQNRVDLQDKEMKDGNLSLILKHVKMEDRGTYECRVFEKRKNELINIIILEVHLPGDQDKNTGDGGDTDEGEKDGGNMVGIIVGSVVGVILLLAVLASVGFLIYRRSTRQNQHVKVPLDERPVA